MYYYLSAIPAHYIETILGSINHFDTVFNIFKTLSCKAVSIVFAETSIMCIRISGGIPAPLSIISSFRIAPFIVA